MKTLSLSEAKMKLSALVDQVHSNDEEIVITKNGRAVAALISADELDRWKETSRVYSDRPLMEEIKRGVYQIRDGKAKLYTLDELFEDN